MRGEMNIGKRGSLIGCKQQNRHKKEKIELNAVIED
jgi:hypothetical protein